MNLSDYNFNIMPATIAAIAVACVYVAVAIFFPEALPPEFPGCQSAYFLPPKSKNALKPNPACIIQHKHRFAELL